MAIKKRKLIRSVFFREDSFTFTLTSGIASAVFLIRKDKNYCYAMGVYYSLRLPLSFSICSEENDNFLISK